MDVPPQDWTACSEPACRADIIFAVTNKIEKGRPVLMPVDVKPSPTGNVILSRAGGRWHAGVAGRNQAAGMRDRGQELHTSHFATCAAPKGFRKPKR